MASATPNKPWNKNIVFAVIVFVVAASVAGMVIAQNSLTSGKISSTACSFNPTGLVIPAVSNSTAFRIAETSPQFLSITEGKTVRYSGSAASIHCNTVESIDANFIVTNAQGGEEDVIVSMAVGPGNVPNGTVISVQVGPVMSS